MKRIEFSLMLMFVWVAVFLVAAFTPKSTSNASEGDGMPCMNYEEPETEPVPIIIEPGAFYEASNVTPIKAVVTPIETTAPPIPVYTVNGALLDPDLQEFAYNTLCGFDMEWYYPTFLCQMYQESRFDQSAVSAHGCCGLCQLKAAYHEYFADLAGIHGADLINDPLANIYVGAFLMSYYYNQCGDINVAISAYNTGFIDKYNGDYVQQVRQWESTLKEVN